MKTLLVDDDFTNSLLLQKYVQPYGMTHIAVNGREAVDAAFQARESGEPYDLICLDIMMPEMDGQEALKLIRKDETEAGILLGEGSKVLMTSGLIDGNNFMQAFIESCDGYLVKPIVKANFLKELRKLSLID